MTKRAKKLEKGIASLDETIREHETREQDARKDGRINLADYLEKEIKSLKERRADRKDKLDRNE